LAGDALLTEAFRMLAGLAPLAGPRFPAILARFSEAAGFLGMVAGQAADLLAEQNVPHRGLLDFIHQHKTGALIEVSATLPAIALNASQGQVDALACYARNLGMVFQIVDDILNVTSSAEELGKPVGSDKERGKSTFPGLYGIATAQDMARRLTTEALAALQGFPAHRTEVLRLLAEHFLNRQK
jgi:geranylgeranyl diphosphate synthase type II